MMSSEEPVNDRKLKPTVQEPEAITGTSTGRKVSANALASIVASHQTTTEAADHPDSAKVAAALDALYMDLYENKLNPIGDAACSFVPVQLVRDYLQSHIPAYDRVGRMKNNFTELKPLNAAIDVIVLLTHRHHECSVEISSIGGVEAIVRVMEAFPNCLALQEIGCAALRNLTYCHLGQQKALEAVQTIPILLAAMKNHLISPCLCVHAVLALRNVIHRGNNESTKLLLSSGGFVTAIEKVRDQWPEEDSVQDAVRMVAFAMPQHTGYEWPEEDSIQEAVRRPQQNTMPSKASNNRSNYRKRKPTAQGLAIVVRTDSDDHQSDRAARLRLQMLAFAAYPEQSSDPSKDRKRKKTAQERDAVVSSGSDDHQTGKNARQLSTETEQTHRKARRVSTEAEGPTVASRQTTEEANHVQHNPKLAMESVLKLFPDLCHSDSAKARATLGALIWDLYEDKLDQLQAAGGYLALVKAVKVCLRNATEHMLACDGRVIKVEFPELNAAIDVIVLLTNDHHERRVGISSFGGVEAIVKVLKLFPKCLALQENACKALCNLTNCHLGKTKALEAGHTIPILLAAVNNHLVSFKLCEYAVLALHNVVRDDNLSTKLLLSSGGVAAAIKVKEKWINKGSVQRAVQMLMVPLWEELNSWKQVN
jgi:hypothetical protein